MRPCNYDEAWGLLVTSKNSPQKNKPDYNYQGPGNNNNSAILNKSQQINSPKSIISTPVHINEKQEYTENIDKCHECLLYVITSPYCMNKLKELSNIFNKNSQETLTNNKKVETVSDMNLNLNYIQQFKNESFKFIENTLESIYLKNNKMNEIILYAIIGIIIGYLFSQYVMNKK